MQRVGRIDASRALGNAGWLFYHKRESSCNTIVSVQEAWDETISLYQPVLAFELASGLRNNAALSYRALGHAAKGKGDLTAARQYYQAALELFTAINSPTVRSIEAELKALDEPEA